MKRIAITLVALLGAATSYAQQPVPEIPFEGNINFLKLPPDMNVGEVSGVAVNSKGDVAIFTRSNSAGGPAYGATASQVLLFDKTGKFLREIGKGLYAWSYAHAIRFDKDDNLWAIDKGSDMIVRINPEGHVTMVFGRKKEASDDAEPWTRVTPPLPPVNGQFRQPTDVAWDTEGNIYISDGYINSRVAKFTKDGDWVASIGEPGRTKIGELNTPHTHRQRRQGQHLRRRSRQPPHPGDRSEDEHAGARDQDRRAGAAGREAVDGRDADGRRRRRAERRAVGDLRHAAQRRRDSSSSTARTPSRAASTSCRSRRQGARLARQVGTSGQAVRLDSRDRVPERERDLRRRAAQLAAAEADAEASRDQEHRGWPVDRTPSMADG